MLTGPKWRVSVSYEARIRLCAFMARSETVCEIESRRAAIKVESPGDHSGLCPPPPK